MANIDEKEIVFVFFVFDCIVFNKILYTYVHICTHVCVWHRYAVHIHICIFIYTYSMYFIVCTTVCIVTRFYIYCVHLAGYNAIHVYQNRFYTGQKSLPQRAALVYRPYINHQPIKFLFLFVIATFIMVEFEPVNSSGGKGKLQFTSYQGLTSSGRGGGIWEGGTLTSP